MTEQGERLLGHVKRFQRQARRVAFAQALSVAAGAAFVVAAGTILMVRTESPAPWFVVATAALSATLIAGAIAWWRTPSLQRTGSAMDHSLQLEDRVVAALQLLQTDDAVAALVVYDAVRTLEGRAPEQVFPMRVGWWAAPAVTGVGLIAAAMTIGVSSSQTSFSPAGSGGGAGGTRMSPATAAEGTAAAGPDAPTFAAVATTVGKPSETAAEQVTPAAGETVASADSSVAPVAPVAPLAPAFAPGGAAGRRSPVSVADAAGVSGSASADGGRTTGDADRPGSRAGGVAGPVTPARRFEPPVNAPGSTMSPGAAAAARAQAEAAMSRGEIPPAFRKHVGDYFTAIQRTAPAK
jgi:hypothetical protein